MTATETPKGSASRRKVWAFLAVMALLISGVSAFLLASPWQSRLEGIFSPSPNLIGSPPGSNSGGGTKSIAILDLASGRVIQSAGNGGCIDWFAFHPNGSRLYCISGDSAGLYYLDVPNGNLTAVQDLGMLGLNLRGAFSADGKWLVASGELGNVQVVDLANGHSVQAMKVSAPTHKQDSKRIEAVALSPNGDYVYASTYFRIIKWNRKSGAIDYEINLNKFLATGLDIDPTGKYLLAYGINTYPVSAAIFDTTTGQELARSIITKKMRPLYSVSTSPRPEDNPEIPDSTFREWDTKFNGKIRKIIIENDIGGVDQWTENKAFCVRRGNGLYEPNSAIQVYDGSSMRLQYYLFWPGQIFTKLSPGSRYLVATTRGFNSGFPSHPESIGHISIKTDLSVTVPAILTWDAHVGHVDWVRFDESANQLVSTGLEDFSLKVWSTKQGRKEFESRSSDIIGEPLFSKDGRYLAVSSFSEGDERGVRIWDLKDGKVIFKGNMPCTGIYFNLENKWFFVGGEIWNIQSDREPELLKILEPETKITDISSVVVSENGKAMAFASNKDLWVYKIEDWTLMFHVDGIDSYDSKGDELTFSTDDQLIRWNYRGPRDSEGGFPNTKIWEIDTGKCVWNGEPPVSKALLKRFKAPPANDPPLHTIGYSRDRKIIARGEGNEPALPGELLK